MGGKRPNELGLYDMSGNVVESCLDWYDGSYYSRSPNADPANTQAATYRVYRGGGWRVGAGFARSAFRGWFMPDRTGHGLGFRACLAPQSAGK